MRRLARRMFALCSAVSLLLCVAVCVLWVRSYATWDDLNYARPTFQCGVSSLKGSVSIGLWTFTFPDAKALQRARDRQRKHSWSHTAMSLSGSSLKHTGYGATSESVVGRDGTTRRRWHLILPH